MRTDGRRSQRNPSFSEPTSIAPVDEGDEGRWGVCRRSPLSALGYHHRVECAAGRAHQYTRPRLFCCAGLVEPVNCQILLSRSASNKASQCFVLAMSKSGDSHCVGDKFSW
jgi:hypothetical protein